MISYRLLLAISYMGLFLYTNAQKQNENLFSKNEIESINSIYYPLYSSDSIFVPQYEKIEFFNLYLFNGDCSLCLGKLKTADDFFERNKVEKIKSIFIVETFDTIMFNFNRDKLKLRTPVLWDKNNHTREIIHINSNNTLLLIDNNGHLYFKGDIFSDDNFMKKYLRIINSIQSI